MDDSKLPKLSSLLARLWRVLSKRRRKQYALLVLIIITASFAEIFSIGAVIPFLGVLISPEKVYGHAFMQPMIQLLKLESPDDILLPLTLLFGMAVLFSGSIRLFLLYAETRLSYATGGDFSVEIYRRTLYQPYTVHASRNSSEVISGITQKTNSVVSRTIKPLIDIISAFFILTTISIALFVIAPLVSLGAILGFGFIYTTVIYGTRKRIKQNSKVISKESVHVMKSLQEGLGGVRDVLLNNTQEAYCEDYNRSIRALQHAQGNNSFVGGSPRFAVEALGTALIAVFAYILTAESHGLAGAIPILGALAMGAQRMLPILQQLYRSWIYIKGHQHILADTLDLLEQPAPEKGKKEELVPIPFVSEIALQKVGFRYREDLPFVLADIDLKIQKGERIGIMGTTGSGKSTLIDVIMGLLYPDHGALSVDGLVIDDGNRSRWQKRIAHVPQAIFLADSSISENVAFGVSPKNINMDKVKDAVQQAQLEDMVLALPEQYDTQVGERGVRMSGGQRQRLGIARALYKEADVIVFDEATSALDMHTEQAVMEAIDGLSETLTIVLIAHRLSTLRNCDRIIQLEQGRIARIGSYKDLVDAE